MKIMMMLGFFISVVCSASWVFSQDTALNGPLIRDAQQALAQGNAKPILKWVRPEDEDKVKEAFNNVMEERKIDAVSADKKFFEILNNIQRQGQCADAASGVPDKILIEEANKSVETGSIEEIKEYIPKEDLSAIQAKLNQVVEKKKHADESLKAGRDFVDEYKNFLKSLQSLAQEARSLSR